MLWYSLEEPQQDTYTEYQQHMLFGEIRKILCGYLLLSEAMVYHKVTFYLILLFNKSILLSMNVCKVAGWVANSVDPDQMLHSAASDLGLHYLLKPAFLNT